MEEKEKTLESEIESLKKLIEKIDKQFKQMKGKEI